MEEIAPQVIAMVERNLAGLSETARARLSACLPHLGNLVEAQCPAVLIPCAHGGIATAYGPQDVQSGDIVLAAATPASGVLFGLADWPDVPDAMAQEFSQTQIGDAVAQGIDEGNLTAVGNGVALLIGKANRDRLGRDIAEIYGKGRTPLVVALIATGPPKLSMYIGVTTLPSRLEDQIARIEAAE